ncbi:MAG: 3-hydroxy-3-methylglutaryl-CoA reductase, partial [Halobacteria archaeon]
GQDVAQVVEGSSGITTCGEKDGDLYVSLTLPSVEVGTVGGGTGIEGQRSCLEMLGVSGGGDPEGSNAKELAEVIGGVALAGEVSLHAALSARHLSGSHDELGR